MARKSPQIAVYNWLSGGPKDLRTSGQKLLEGIWSSLEDEGFEWTNYYSALEGQVAPGVAYFERYTDSRLQFVEVFFNKYKDRNFQVIFGSFTLPPDSKLLESGAIKRKKSELAKHGIWGASMISIFRARALERAVEKVLEVFPEVTRYLNDGTDGAHIYVQ